MAALDVDVDDIEQLLSQLEGGGGDGGAGSRRQPTAAQRQPPPTTTTAAATPGVAFSTYGNAIGNGGGGGNGTMFFERPSSTSLHGEGPRVVGRLAPISGSRGGAQHEEGSRGNAVLWSQHKHRVDGGDPALLRGDAVAVPFPTATTEAAGSKQPPPPPSSSAAVVDDVNFLPVMHTRFLNGAGGITPRPRWGHTLTPVGDGQLLLFGGTTAPHGEATNDIFAYQPKTNAWEPMLSADRASMPQPRYHHAAAMVDQRYLVVYGGRSSHGTTTLGDMLAYDILRQEWSTWFAPGSGRGSSGGVGGKSEPSSIYGHSMVAHKQRLYVFGGRVRRSGGADVASDKEIGTNDVFVFHWPTKQWKRRIHYGGGDARQHGGGSPPSAPRGPASGVDATASDAAGGDGGGAAVPSKRLFHAACVHGTEHMVVHGGESQDGTHIATDTWALHIASKRWVCLHDGSTPDSVPRSRHALHSSGEAILAVGGCSRVSSTALAQRLESFLSVLPVSTKPAATKLSACGGVGDCTTAPTMVSTNYWSPVVLGNGACAQPSLRQFGSAVVDGFLYVFGGHPTTGAEAATNHMLRCLATDGVPRAPGEGLSTRMRQLVFSRSGTAPSSSPQRGGGGGSAPTSSDDLAASFPYRWDCDLALVVGDGCRLYVHRAMLAVRAPLFYQELLQCRSEEGSEESSLTEGGGGGGGGGRVHAAFEPPAILVNGNSRVKGLSVVVNAAQLVTFLTFVYTGAVDPSAAVSHGTTLQQLSKAYELPSLSHCVSSASPAADADDNVAGGDKTASAKPSAAATSAPGQAQLLADMKSLLAGNLLSNATILFVDPHTNQETTHTAHTWVLASGCLLLQQLLRPLWTTIDGSAHSHQVNGITAKLVGKRAVPLQKSGGGGGGGSRRNVIIGPIRIPVLGIDAVLRFLYTNETDVEPHCALHAMIAATILQLTPLQRHCEAIVAREEVNYASCCDFITLAQNYHAQLLEEMSLVTAAVGFDDVKRSPGFQRLEAAQREQIETIAGEVRGLWAAPTPPHTEQKTADVYAARLPPPASSAA